MVHGYIDLNGRFDAHRPDLLSFRHLDPKSNVNNRNLTPLLSMMM